MASGLRRIIGNMGWLFFDRAVRLTGALFVGVWVARYLGPSRFGSLSFATAFVALFGTITTLGLEMMVVRELVNHPAETHEILGTTLMLRGCGALLAVVLCVATICLLQPHDNVAQLLVAIIAGGLVFQAFDTVDLFFQSEVKSKITVWAKNSAFVIFAIVRISLIYIKAPLWPFAAAATGEAALGAMGLLIGYHWSGKRILSWRWSGERALELLKQSWPVALSGMAIMIYMRIDMVMLKMMQGDAVVGLYAAATRISEVWYFIPAAIVSSVAPSIMRAKGRPKIYYSRIRKLFFLMTLTAYVIGSAVAFASHPIIRMLYSNAYSGAAPVLAVHIWASVFVFLGTAQGPWDMSENLLKLSLYRTCSGAAINVLANLYLIPKYSAMGAAIATVSAYAVSAVFANAFSAQTRPIFLLQMKSFLPFGHWGDDERPD